MMLKTKSIVIFKQNYKIKMELNFKNAVIYH